MSTSKHINIICLVVTLLTLLLTGLFMNGEALGITPIVDGDAETGQFTTNDLNADWDSSNATRITLTGDSGKVTGSGAYVYDGDVHILYAGEYVISGELTNGSVIIDADSNDKIWILLDGVSLHCDDNAAILVEEAGKVFLTLASGTENFISCGAEYSEDAISSKVDGAIYSRDDLTINGSGFLSITAEYKHGIVCNDDIVVVGANIEITAPQDGIHAHDSGRFADMDLTINAGDDGITVKDDETEISYIYIESGNINITSCYEGIEAVDITIAGGKIDIRPTDDGINACGQGRNSAIRITGGDITIINESGRDADGLDSNGDLLISGGNTFISVNTSSYALDYGSENGGVCKISGGTVIAAGGSTMAEGFDSSSEQCFIMYNTSTTTAGTTVTLVNESGNVLISEAIPCAFSNVVLSTPDLQLGETCTLSIGDTDAEITVDNSTTSSGFGMGGMFGGGMNRGGSGMGDIFGGRDGKNKTDRSSDNPSNTDDTNTEDKQSQSIPELPSEGSKPQDIPDKPDGNVQPQDIPGGNAMGDEVPQMPDGDLAGGEMPQMPDGNLPDGEVPQMPDGNLPDGEVPQMPDGNLSDGEMPQMPDGDLSDGEMPQMPDGDFANGDVPQKPDGDSETSEMPQMSDNDSVRGGNRGGDDQSMQRGQNQDWRQSDAAPETSAVSPATLLLVGISILSLLAGILIALKVKH